MDHQRKKNIIHRSYQIQFKCSCHLLVKPYGGLVSMISTVIKTVSQSSFLSSSYGSGLWEAKKASDLLANDSINSWVIFTLSQRPKLYWKRCTLNVSRYGQRQQKNDKYRKPMPKLRSDNCVQLKMCDIKMTNACHISDSLYSAEATMRHSVITKLNISNNILQAMKITHTDLIWFQI